MEDVYGEASAARPIWSGFLTENIRPLGPEELSRFRRKRVLITGAGGYLGSSLARALAALPIAHLVLLDQAEYGLYRLDQDVQDASQGPPTSLIVGSVGDRALLKCIFAEHAPEIIFHAAALKHVPLMEANAFAAVETNVLGTHALVETALHSPPESFILLSTDKAADPISVMGATKRIAEQIVLRARDHDSAFSAVRLCNVLGSTGSVAPRFACQIANGGPVTLTHPEATRFFISRTDAVRCLLRSAITPSQTGLIVPLLDRPHRVADLVHFLLQHSPAATSSTQIVHTGLRPGDKLHEQLLSCSESAEPGSSDTQMLAVHSSFDRVQLKKALAAFQSALAERDHVRLLNAIRSAVPGYCGQSAAIPTRSERYA